MDISGVLALGCVLMTWHFVHVYHVSNYHERAHGWFYHPTALTITQMVASLICGAVFYFVPEWWPTVKAFFARLKEWMERKPLTLEELDRWTKEFHALQAAQADGKQVPSA